MAAVLSCGVAAAQEAQPAKECCEGFKFDLASDVSLYNFEDGNIFAVTEKFTYTVDEKIKLGASVSLFNDQNKSFNPREFAWQLNDGVNDVSGTGIGDVDFFLTYNLLDSKCDFLKTDFATLDFIVGGKVPVQGAYSSSDVVLYVGGEAGVAWGNIALNQNFTYSFVDGYTYSPVFGGFVNDDVYGGVTTLSYVADKDFVVSVNAEQQYFGSNSAFLVGPEVSWTFCKNATFNASVDFPVVYDAPSADLNVVVSAGIGFQF
jgi:hypothetical protein